MSKSELHEVRARALALFPSSQDEALLHASDERPERCPEQFLHSCDGKDHSLRYASARVLRRQHQVCLPNTEAVLPLCVLSKSSVLSQLPRNQICEFSCQCSVGTIQT